MAKGDNTRKLSYADVRAIRKEYQETKVLQRELAERYGVCKQSILNALNFKTFKDV